MEVIEDGEMRSLYFSGRHLQSRQWISDPSALILPYTWYMMAFPLVRLAEPERALMIGVGAGSMIHFLRRHFPACAIDAVDISSDILAISRDFFDLREDDFLRIYCQDGGAFLRQNDTRYDLILLDAFDGEGMAADLYAAPFFALTRKHLREDGILVCNLWSSQASVRRDAFRQLRRSFADTIFLPVPERGNMVSLSAALAMPWREICADNPRLRQLSDRFGLDFVTMAEIARNYNGGEEGQGGFWRRLLRG